MGQIIFLKENHIKYKRYSCELIETQVTRSVFYCYTYITCEGWYGLVFYHHFRLITVVLGYKLNLPYYLQKILMIMSKFYQRGFKNPEHTLFHYGLIRILVNFILNQLGVSWDAFLCWNNFVKSSENSRKKIFPLTEKINKGFHEHV